MEITDVRVFLVGQEKLRAYVTITLDHCFVVRDLRVIQGSSGMFVAMPARRRKDGSFRDVAHPVNPQTRQWMEKVILAEYGKQLERAAPVAAPATGAGERVEQKAVIAADDDEGA